MIISFNRYNGGGSGSGSTDLTNYWTSAQTESAITVAVEPKADKKILIDFDRTPQADRATLYSTLKGLYDGGSGATINKDYDFFKTVGPKQGLKIDYYTFSGDTAVFGKVVSPDNISDQVVYGQVLTIDSAGSVNVVTNTVGGGASGVVDSTVLKPVSEFPEDPELGDMVSRVDTTMPTFWWNNSDNTTYKMHIDPLVLDTEAAYDVISFETQADGILWGRILYDDHNQVMTLKFFDEEDNEVYLLGNLNKARSLDIAIGDGYYVGIGFLDDDFTSEGGRMLQVGRTDGTFGNWQGNADQIPELDVEDIEVEDERTGEIIPGIPDAAGPWFYNGHDWVSVGDYASGPIWKTIGTINSDIDTLNDRVDEISASTPTVDLSNYYTSAQTEEAISAATSGKADAANVTANSTRKFPYWNAQGIITGVSSDIANYVYEKFNGRNIRVYGPSTDQFDFYAPTTSGNPGEVLVSTGNGAPVWSAVTMPDMSAYYTSAQTAYEIYTRTQDMVTSTDDPDYNIGRVSHIVKLTQADYDQLVLDDGVDDSTLYIIVSQSS